MKPNLEIITGTADELHKASVIETLEEVLAEAREGKITAVAVAYLRPYLSCNTRASTTPCNAALLGAIELLRARTLEEWQDE
jgi:hypothetical protein